MHPKSFVSNFWGALHVNRLDSNLIAWFDCTEIKARCITEAPDSSAMTLSTLITDPSSFFNRYHWHSPFLCEHRPYKSSSRPHIFGLQSKILSLIYLLTHFSQSGLYTSQLFCTSISLISGVHLTPLKS